MIAFDIIIKAWPSTEWTNILQFGYGSNNYQYYYGNRAPMISLNSKNKNIYIWNAFDGNANFYKHYPVSLNQSYQIRIDQYPSNGMIQYLIEVNGYPFFMAENKGAQSFRNIWVYASNPWDEALTSGYATVGNLRIFTDPKCKFSKYTFLSK